MPPSFSDEGLRAAAAIREDHPGTRVLVLSQDVDEAYALELLAEDLRLAHAALGEITGEFGTEALLGEIFGRFCIGK